MVQQITPYTFRRGSNLDNYYDKPLKAATLIALLLFAGSSAHTKPQVHREMMTAHEDTKFINAIPQKSDGREIEMQPKNRICDSPDSQGGVTQTNDQTIRQLLGPKLESITIKQVTNFETHDKFSLARETIEDIMQKSPKCLYRYEPWSNAIQADFVAQLNYENGKTGELRCTPGYVCFQDAQGTHWWARFTMPGELNLQSRTGVLSFVSPHGYCLTEPNEHRIWLRVAEDKVFIKKLELMNSKKVTVTGEIRRQSKNSTSAVPGGEDYFAYGFTINE